MQLEISQHAAVRMNQRGVPRQLLEQVLIHADVEVPVGRGCTSFSVSRERLGDRDVRRSFGAQVDHAAGIAVVCGDMGAVVTVLRVRREAGRRYRGRC